MGRAVEEWIGATPDTPAPPRVRLRRFDHFNGVCQLTFRKIRPGDKWELHHAKALINGGENRESNLVPVLKAAHKLETAANVAEKSRVYAKRLKHVGITPKAGRPFPGSRRDKWMKPVNGKPRLRNPERSRDA